MSDDGSKWRELPSSSHLGYWWEELSPGQRKRLRVAAGRCWRRGTLCLSLEQLKFYWRLFVQHRSPEYHFLSREGWLLAERKGRRQCLRLENIRRASHLRTEVDGRGFVAPRGG